MEAVTKMAAETDHLQQPQPQQELLSEACELISEIAYFKAQQRGFVPGHELDDWLAAEEEFNLSGANEESWVMLHKGTKWPAEISIRSWLYWINAIFDLAKI